MKKISFVLSVAVSIAALITSIFGIVLANQANQSAKEQYIQDRLLTLQGIFSEKDNASIKVKAIGDNAYFQQGTLFFPPSIHKEAIPIDSEGKFWHMVTVTANLEDYFLSKVTPKDGIVKISNGSVPILIKSYYVSKGKAYSDTSLYFLGMQTILGDSENARPKIQYNSLLFVERYEEKDSISLEILDRIVENPTGYYIRANLPQ